MKHCRLTGTAFGGLGSTWLLVLGLLLAAAAPSLAQWPGGAAGIDPAAARLGLPPPAPAAAQQQPAAAPQFGFDMWQQPAQQAMPQQAPAEADPTQAILALIQAAMAPAAPAPAPAPLAAAQPAAAPAMQPGMAFAQQLGLNAPHAPAAAPAHANANSNSVPKPDFNQLYSPPPSSGSVTGDTAFLASESPRPAQSAYGFSVPPADVQAARAQALLRRIPRPVSDVDALASIPLGQARGAVRGGTPENRVFSLERQVARAPRRQIQRAVHKRPVAQQHAQRRQPQPMQAQADPQAMRRLASGANPFSPSPLERELRPKQRKSLPAQPSPSQKASSPSGSNSKAPLSVAADQFADSDPSLLQAMDALNEVESLLADSVDFTSLLQLVEGSADGGAQRRQRAPQVEASEPERSAAASATATPPDHGAVDLSAQHPEDVSLLAVSSSVSTPSQPESALLASEPESFLGASEPESEFFPGDAGATPVAGGFHSMFRSIMQQHRRQKQNDELQP